MPEHDLVTAVTLAAKARSSSPFVGIANGHGTMMFLRKRLKATLEGLVVIDAEVGPYKSELSCLSCDRALIIHAQSPDGRVKAKRVFVPERAWRTSPLLDSWQRSERRKMGRCDCYEFKRLGNCKHLPKSKLDKYAAAIAKLEKQLPREWRPENPAVPKYALEPAEEGTRRHEQAWKLQRGVRREIMRIARSGQATAKIYAAVSKLTVTDFEMVNWQEAYNTPKDAEVMPMYQWITRPVVVKKWSDLRTHDRGRVGDLFEYLKRLWEFCELADKPYHNRKEPAWGAKHYQEWLKDLYERKELTEQIAAIRAEAAGAAGKEQTS